MYFFFVIFFLQYVIEVYTRLLLSLSISRLSGFETTSMPSSEWTVIKDHVVDLYIVSLIDLINFKSFSSLSRNVIVMKI